jgi:Fic family protein
MKRLDRLLAADRREPRAFAATVALLLITNCHAFTDGNGRVARVVFNAVLRPSEPAVTHYLPLREIATFARGGYIIRARQAEIHGNWAPLADFMLAAVRFWQGRLTAQLPSARSGNSTGAPPPGRPSAAQDSLSLQR